MASGPLAVSVPSAGRVSRAGVYRVRDVSSELPRFTVLFV
jgi:hypothetical protein